MKNTLFLFLEAINYYEAKLHLKYLKKNKILLLIVKFLIFFSAYTLIILAPSFFLYNSITVGITFSTLFLSALLGLLIRYKFRFTRIELLDKKILKKSIQKVDFEKSLKNNIIFNINFALILTGISLVYNIFIYAFLLISSGGIALIACIIVVSFLTIGTSIILFGSFLMLLLKNKNNKSLFVELNKKGSINSFIIYNILISILFFLILFFILIHFTSNYLFSFIISFVISVGFSAVVLLIKFYLNKKKIGHANYFNLIKLQIDNYNLKNKFKSYIKLLKLFNILFPLIIGIIFFVLISLLNGTFKLDIKIRIFQSLLVSMFFTYPLFSKFLKKDIQESIKKPFTLTIFISIVILLLSFLSVISLKYPYKTESIAYKFKDFIIPYITSFNLFSMKISNILSSIKIYFVILIPLAFFAILYISHKLNKLFHDISKKIDFKLRKSLTNQNPSIIFGDSISLYPFIFSALGNFLIIIFISISILPITNFFSNLVETFQISQIFKIKFLDKSSILAFFNFLFVIMTGIIILKLLLNFFSSIFSHFILFSDEIIYHENKIFNRTILRIPLSRINYVIVKQNIIEKLFDFGTIYIETVDKNGLIKINGISSIKEKNILIMDKIKGGI